MKLELNHHTVLMLVGPTRCGKSTFAQTLSEELGMEDMLVLSSDAYRSTLIEGGSYLHPHDPRMAEVSEGAFKRLMNDLEVFTSYPVNTPFVVVDTRGSDPAFRSQVSAIARRNKYKIVPVVFNYKTASEYLEGLTEPEAEIARRDVNRFRRNVLPELRAKDYDKIIRVKSKDECKNIEVSLPDMDEYLSCQVHNRTVAVVGDSHECVDELDALVYGIKHNYPDAQIIHVGDYLDKGKDTERMLSYMKSRVEAGDIIVQANHEAYLYRRLKGEIDPAPEEVEREFFTALPTLLESEELRNLFFNLYEGSVPYAKITGEMSRTVYVTHAPCDESYLGKHSLEAKRAMRNLRTKDRSADPRADLSFLFKQATMNKPLHVFGHVAHNSPNLVFKNKIFLDTGAAAGNKLTAMVWKDNQYGFVSIPSEVRMASELPTNLTVPMNVEKKFNIHDYNLEVEDIKFLNRTIRNGVKYISGTMAPAPSAGGKLEPLSGALDYFKSKGVDKVVLQPKYMGSRCQMYLYKDPEKQSFAVSRNGYVIRHVEGLDQVIADWLTKVDGWYDGSWHEIILDGELLPWKALGEGLIDGQFRTYESLVGFELSELSADAEFAKLDIAQNYDAGGRLSDLALFSHNLDLYAKDTGLEYKAFNILSVDGKENMAWADEMFETVNDDKYLVVDLNNEDDVARAADFFAKLTTELGMEGVVVKPLIPKSGVVPYMKVRNEGYLTLVYGYDYHRRYSRLVGQKNISFKAKVSLKEHELGQAMLFAKTDDERKEYIVKMIAELHREKEMDPRL